MKYASVFRNKNINNFLKLLKKNKLVIFLWICLITGMILGTTFVSFFDTEILYKINFLFKNDFETRINQSWKEIFISSFFNLNLFVFATELSAVSCWGIFLIPIIITIRGLSLGLSTGYLYLMYKLKGIAFYLLILLPGMFLSSVGHNKFSAESMKISFDFTKLFFYNNNFECNFKQNLVQNFKKLCNCLILMMISSILDVCFILLFSNFFEF